MYHVHMYSLIIWNYNHIHNKDKDKNILQNWDHMFQYKSSCLDNIHIDIVAHNRRNYNDILRFHIARDRNIVDYHILILLVMLMGMVLAWV